MDRRVVHHHNRARLAVGIAAECRHQGPDDVLVEALLVDSAAGGVRVVGPPLAPHPPARRGDKPVDVDGTDEGEVVFRTQVRVLVADEHLKTRRRAARASRSRAAAG